MRLTKLGLSTIVLTGLTVSSFAANSLSDALKNGKFNGEFKAIYYDVDKAAGGQESITSSTFAHRFQ
ncbi:MAG: hypothetical protein L3J44_02310 [Campylobacteraceae bacterium]|nr:hypothetical protein [Campylobacteraceae bacterium]